MRKLSKKNEGFTLIELLIVVAIIGIIAGIAIPNFLGARTKARVTRAFADMHAIADAIESYYLDNATYPPAGTGATVPDTLSPNYITNLPKDPFGTAEVPGYRYYTNPAVAGEEIAGTAWLLVSNGPDTDEDVPAGGTIDWTARVAGQLGGSEGASSGYGFNWYDPAAGATSNGDLGRGGP